MRTAKLSCLLKEYYYSDVRCEQCRPGEREDELVLCDRCVMGYHYHLYFLRPIAVRVPVGPWFCPSFISGRTVRSMYVDVLVLFSLEFWVHVKYNIQRSYLVLGLSGFSQLLKKIANFFFPDSAINWCLRGQRVWGFSYRSVSIVLYIFSTGDSISKNNDNRVIILFLFHKFVLPLSFHYRLYKVCTCLSWSVCNCFSWCIHCIPFFSFCFDTSLWI